LRGVFVLGELLPIFAGELFPAIAFDSGELVGAILGGLFLIDKGAI